MTSIISVNTTDNQPIEVYYQDEVELQLDLNLMYIKSGQKEIQDYVDNVSKPEINNYVETEAKPIVTQVANQIAEPLVNEYIETETKPSIDEYVNGLKPSLQTYVDQAQEDANSAATSMEQAALSATAASNYASNASADADNAAESAGLAANSAAEANQSEEKAAEYLQQINNKITVVEGSIGDIGFAPLGIDEAQNKRRYLNGQVISQAQFVSFTDKLKSIVALYPNLATTEVNWQAEVTNSKLGQCGKFVINDTAGTIRLPKVVNVQGLQDLALMGGIKAESLPNIEGTYVIGCLTNGTPTTSGALYTYGSGPNSAGEAGSSPSIGFDASRSSSTYQDNAPVQQEAIQYPYFIQVATRVEESIDVTREIELNNPFSLLDYKWSEYEITNASWLISNGAFHSGATYQAVYELLLKIKNGTETKDGVSVKLSTEAYTDTDFVINTANTTFRLPIKVKLASGNAVVGNGMTLGLTDGVRNIGVRNTSSAGYLVVNTETYGSQVGNASGPTPYKTQNTVGLTTDPTKSGIETSSSGLKLYFYVGETIQDANVIAASQVLTDVANLKGYDYVVESYQNGCDWYRVYKSGWIEQGGQLNGDGTSSGVRVNLLKPYANSIYNVTLSAEMGLVSAFPNASVTNCKVRNRTTTGFNGACSYNGGNSTSWYQGTFCWRTAGQGA